MIRRIKDVFGLGLAVALAEEEEDLF